MEWVDDVKDFCKKIDSNLISGFQVGLQLGVLVLTTLVFFPGRDQSVPRQNLSEATVDNRNGNGDNGALDRNGNITGDPDTPDAINKEWTPHQKLNTCVYILLVSVLMVVLDREYGGILTTTFRIYFPREASALGFAPTQ